ncbi:glucose 1-dehydrogenase [Loigolactobacillus jiayinensis]|uniref:Glucose 1-dehydrogenase n=1 Tax=Loigolactobacillus jiayinensis TaxID=2486016 RepID=A0ABW1RJ95_9LACO|nr:glucose 1-dehydrogenase [Loigolactobacillus jiayinensis]
MTGRLAGKVALITGGTKGIGLGCAQRFIEEGAKVVITGRHADLGEQAVATVNAPDDIIFLTQDTGDDKQWPQIIKAVQDKFGKLDILVNNAGICFFKDVEHTTAEEWRKLQAINLDGVFFGTKYAMIAMKEHGGSIINMSSIEGFIGEPMLAAYNASKGGVRLFSKSAALYAAKEGYNVRVNTVHPGYIHTPLVDCAPDVVTHEEQLTPMGHLGEPLDIANMCLFLASDEAKFATGAEFVVDGGYTAQ